MVEYDFEKYLSLLWDIFVSRCWDNVEKRKKKSMGFLWFASVNPDLVDMKTAPALRANLVLLSCEEQTIYVLFTELRFGRGPDLSSLMWSLTLHYPLQEIMQSLCILCLLMEKMMNEQKRSGLIVCYWIFNWTGYILGNDNLYIYASVIGVVGRYVRLLGLTLLST